jgi:predicted permease
VYGAGQIFNFAVVDLGQVTFVFFILVPYVLRLSTGAISFGQTLRNFLKTPVIVAIFLGIVANRLGVLAALQGWPVSAAVVRTVELLGGLTMPLIALVIGYEVRLQRGSLLKPAEAIALRLLVWVPVGLLVNALVVRPLFGDAPVLEAAVLTMFVLPPPFVIPLFMREPEGADRTFVVNTLSLATLVTLVAFTMITVVYRP